MRAQRLHQPAPIDTRPLRLEEVPVPEPGPGQVRLAVRVCAICRTDLHVVEGDLETRLRPVTPGHQVVGEVTQVGQGVERSLLGRRVGVAWLHATCGECRFCVDGRENLCDAPDFTGWTVHGGYADQMLAHAEFVYPLPEPLDDEHVAPLLCAGIIGYRALRLAGLEDFAGKRLGIYGFGAAGHVAIQIARARGAEVYVSTRNREKHAALAEELGAAWTGGSADAPPVALDAGLIFAPAGELVPVALSHLDRGATLVLGGIHMSDTPPLRYELLYGERVVRSVANNTRRDGQEFLEEAARVGVRTHVERFDLQDANEALVALAHGGIRGAGVLRVA